MTAERTGDHSSASPFDLIVRGGRVFDPDRGRDQVADVGIRSGRIDRIEADLPAAGAKVVEAAGNLVIPGLIDLHTHVYRGGAPLGIDADALAGPMGVTTWVDAGTSGAGNFASFRRHVIDPSPVRILPFLNMSFIGLTSVRPGFVPFGELADIRLLDVEECIRSATEHQGVVRGLKLRASADAAGANVELALRSARFAADHLDLPLMVHISVAPPTIDDVLPYLKAGDILTHCYTPFVAGIFDRAGRMRPSVVAARERGVVFDLGHGAGSFGFAAARQAIEQGFLPDCISSDLHTLSIGGSCRDLVTTMSKLLALGVTLDDVVRRTTARPAEVLGMVGEIGTLEPGACADVTILTLVSGEAKLEDVRGAVITAAERLEVVATIARGCVLP